MWWTPDGERILQGAEAQLFREALGVLVDMVGDDAIGDWQFNAPPFDALHRNQKLALLAQVGIALLHEDQPMPKLTAVLEAAVGAIYESIRIMVEIEVDQPAEDQEQSSWRELVLTACQQRGIDDLLDPESEDLDEWEVLVECLADTVLWDQDWKDSQTRAPASEARFREWRLDLKSATYCSETSCRQFSRRRVELGWLAGVD
jgi:hypothetical protein